MASGFSPLQPNEAVQPIADRVKGELQDKVGVTFFMFTAVLYKTEIQGDQTAYLIKVQTGVNQCCHILVNVKLGGGSEELAGFIIDMPLYEPLEPFRAPPAAPR